MHRQRGSPAVSPQVVMPLAGCSSGELGAAALLALARDGGLDLRRRLLVAFLIDFGTQREDAYAAARSVRDTDWDSSLYGDVTGWVLRLSRIRQLTREAVTDDVTEVHHVATRCRGQVRGVTVEDLRQEDVWGELASRLQDGSRRSNDSTAPAAAIPSPRQNQVARADR